MQVCTSLQTDNHASTPPLSFLQAGCPSCRPTNSINALKAKRMRRKQQYTNVVLKTSQNMGNNSCITIIPNKKNKKKNNNTKNNIVKIKPPSLCDTAENSQNFITQTATFPTSRALQSSERIFREVHHSHLSALTALQILAAAICKKHTNLYSYYQDSRML